MSFHLYNLSHGINPPPQPSTRRFLKHMNRRPIFSDMTLEEQISEIKNARFLDSEADLMISKLQDNDTSTSKKIKIEDAFMEHLQNRIYGNQFLPSTITEALAQSSRLTTREWVVAQENISVSTLNILAQDSVADIRQRATARL